MALVSVGCGFDVDVELECPSPDGLLTAILFSESGGGAAGWFTYQLSLQPGNRSPILANWNSSRSVSLLTVDEAGDEVTIDWETNERLTIVGLPTLPHVLQE